MGLGGQQAWKAQVRRLDICQQRRGSVELVPITGIQVSESQERPGQAFSESTPRATCFGIIRGELGHDGTESTVIKRLPLVLLGRTVKGLNRGWARVGAREVGEVVGSGWIQDVEPRDLAYSR